MTLDPNNQNQDTTNKEIASMIGSLTRTVQSLSEVLSTHVKSNLETLREIREYIGSQIAYRAYREDIEESRLKLEIRYKEKLLQEETTESDALKLERDKLKIELETLKKNLEVVQLVKHSTQEKMNAVQAKPSSNGGLSQRAKETIALTTVAFLTTSFLGGVITIIYFVVKLYITNNP